MNKVELLGNISHDPISNKEQTVCNFDLAVKRDMPDKDGNKITDFFIIKALGKKAELCMKYLAKGSKVAVVGSLQNRKYTSRDGTEKSVTEIIADTIEFLTPASEKPKAKLVETNESMPWD